MADRRNCTRGCKTHQRLPLRGSWKFAVSEFSEGVKQTKSTTSFFIFFAGGPGKISISPLRPPCTPLTPLKRSLREGVRHGMPCLYRTKRRPEQGAVERSETEGLTIPSEATFFFNPSVHSLSLMSTSPFRAGLICKLVKRTQKAPPPFGVRS